MRSFFLSLLKDNVASGITSTEGREKGMRWIGSWYAGLGFGILVFCAAGGANAQVPIPNEPAEINACVCLQLASGALAADKDAKSQAWAAASQQLADLNAQLASERVGSTLTIPTQSPALKRCSKGAMRPMLRSARPSRRLLQPSSVIMQVSANITNAAPAAHSIPIW